MVFEKGKIIHMLTYLSVMSWRRKGGGIAPPFLTSELDGGECLASRPAVLPPGKELLVPIG
jgi:hypothetical protein